MVQYTYLSEGFVHAGSVHEIHVEPVNDGAELHLEVVWDMLDCTNGDTDFLNTVIVGDGSTGMTQKPRCIHHSGDIHYPQDQRKQSKW